METLRKEDVIQAVLIADNYNDSFQPLNEETSPCMLPLVNTPMIDYALEALNRSKVEEVFIFGSNFIDEIKAHVNKRLREKCSWSVEMVVHVIGSEGCYCLGDALRDLYAKRLLRNHFVLLNANTVTSADLFKILQTHIKTCKFDDGAAMTVVYKKSAPGLVTGQEVVIASDGRTNRLLFHQRRSMAKDDRHCTLPLEIFIEHSEVELRHDLIDPEIAICSPAVLSLFADNFDFETRNDFVRGLLINEEILASTIYVAELPSEQYAIKVDNWQLYQLASHDIINRWAYPLVPDMGICSLEQNYMFLRNNVYRNKRTQLARSSVLRENVVVQEKSSIGEGSELANSVVGANCIIGRNCVLENAFIFDGVNVGDKCILKNCVVGANTKINKETTIHRGSIVGGNCVIPAQSSIDKQFIVSRADEDSDFATFVKLGDKAFVKSSGSGNDTKTSQVNITTTAVDSDDEEDELAEVNPYMTDIEYKYESSDYSSSSNESESIRMSPIPDDANIFLTEVIDSLERGFKEKTNPDFLILEINSSRYAYNMSLSEVNFYVVKALLNLYPIKEANGNVLTAFNQIFAQLNGVMKNYIRGADAMRDCLKAIEESCHQNEMLKSKVAQIIHFLYDKEIVTEESILAWHDEIDDDKEWIRQSLKKLIEWLNETSEEESDDDDDESD